jgi:hypothetical protein
MGSDVDELEVVPESVKREDDIEVWNARISEWTLSHGTSVSSHSKVGS